jgi:predicted small metal-binding protein
MPTRKIADCRKMPSEMKCSLAISGTEEEVLRVATRHAIEEHGHPDTPALREQIRQLLVDESGVPSYSASR